MSKRYVYRIPRAGNIENLKLQEEEIADPSENEIQIDVKAIGFNFADIFALTGLYSATPKGSFIPGLELSGEVSKVGKNVKNFRIGDSVMGVTRFGGYVTKINLPTDYVIHSPNGWSFEESASFVVQALTAYYALIPLGNLQKGDTVLVHSAAGGVGIYANRIAKLWNAHTIGSIGSPSKIDVLKKEGYNDIIVRDSQFLEKLKKSLGSRELHIVLECIGGSIFWDSYKALRKGGRIVCYGAAEFTPNKKSPDYLKLGLQYLFRPKIDPLEMMTENKSVMAFNLIWLYERSSELGGWLAELMKLPLAPPLVGKVFPFQEAHKALDFFQSGQSVGKVILTV
jgi:alcohol dehydrogenase